MEQFIQYLMKLGLSREQAVAFAAPPATAYAHRERDAVEGDNSAAFSDDPDNIGNRPAITTNPIEERMRAVRQAREQATTQRAQPGRLEHAVNERDAKLRERHPNYQPPRQMPSTNAQGY